MPVICTSALKFPALTLLCFVPRVTSLQSEIPRLLWEMVSGAVWPNNGNRSLGEAQIFDPHSSCPSRVSNVGLMSSVIPALDHFPLYGLSISWVLLVLGLWSHHIFLLYLQPWGLWEVPTVLLTR